jgi:hypothetical protein
VNRVGSERAATRQYVRFPEECRSSTFAELKAQHCQDLFARLPEMIAYIGYIGWSQEQLRLEQERRLPELIDTSLKRSTWAPRPAIGSRRPAAPSTMGAGRCNGREIPIQ